MADNFKQTVENIERDIDPNGAAGSILAQNHQNILKDILNKVGKYVGNSYVAQKNITGNLSNGQFSFEGNGLNPSAEITIAFARINADNIDLREQLSKLVKNSIIVFKDFAGRKAQFKFISYVENSTRNAYIVTVENFDGNPEYTYQDSEQEICVFSFFSRSSNFQVLNSAEFRVLKNSGNTNFATNKLNGVVVDGLFQSGNVLIHYRIYNNTLSDNDINNFGTLANNYTDGNYSSVKFTELS